MVKTCSRYIWCVFVGRMYARSGEHTLLTFLADVHVNARCMLLFVVRKYVWGPTDVRSANSTRMYGKMPNILYFLEYPLDDTWTYETTLGLLCKSTGRTLGLADIRYFSEELVEPLSYKYPYPSQFFMSLFAPKLPVDRVCECSMCFSAVRGGTLEVLLQGGNARLPSSLIMSLCCSIFVLRY